MTTRWLWSPRRKSWPAAWRITCAIAAVIGIWLVRPLIPSLPKNLRVIAKLPRTFPLPSCGRPSTKGLIAPKPRKGDAFETLAADPDPARSGERPRRRHRGGVERRRLGRSERCFRRADRRAVAERAADDDRASRRRLADHRHRRLGRSGARE